MQSDELKRRISAGRGDALADLVLKNAKIVNVFTDEIDTADIAISGNSIVGVGTYHGRKEVDLHGKYVCPGLIDGHIHIESSMLCGPAFEQAVLPHGTTAVVTDPHEISNVAGLEGLDFMLETTNNLTLSVYFMLPSCVPATDLDESGAVLNAEQLRPYYGNPRVLGLAELMNAYGTVRCDPKILQKIRDCTEAGKIVDGHAPLLSAKDLNAYIAAGVQSDHECSNIEEAMEKLRRGQYIMIREGTAAKNMEALMPLFREPYCSRCMLVTDDKHPGDLLDSGHIDSNIRKAIRLGADPAVAVKMATLVPAQYFGFKQRGAVAPGYRADLVVVPDLESFTVEQVYKNGTLVAEHGKTLKPAPLEIDHARFYGEHRGLGLISGEVCPLADDLTDPALKVPHIGWNAMDIVPGREADPLFKYVKNGEYVYYVHSYYAKSCAASTLATSDYSIPVTGAVRQGLVYGTQFHPEKSGDTGLRLLKAFAEL